MKLTLFITSLCFITSCYSCKKNDKPGTVPEKDPVSVMPKDTTWELDAARSDEFDNLDTQKWSAAPLWYYGGVSEAFAYKAENTTVSGGTAHLSAKKESYNGMEYTAGCLKSSFEVGGNTYIEVRAKMVSSVANVCAAIWLGDEPVDAKSPNIEIDMQETKDADNAPHLVNSSLLTWPKPGNGNTVPGFKLFYISKGLDEAFHLYGLERRNGKLGFFLDGIKYWEWNTAETPEFVTQLRPVILSLEGHAGAPVDANLPADFEVDWVRVYNAK